MRRRRHSYKALRYGQRTQCQAADKLTIPFRAYFVCRIRAQLDHSGRGFRTSPHESAELEIDAVNIYVDVNYLPSLM